MRTSTHYPKAPGPYVQLRLSFKEAAELAEQLSHCISHKGILRRLERYLKGFKASA